MGESNRRAENLADVLAAHTGLPPTWRDAFAQTPRELFVPTHAHFSNNVTEAWEIDRDTDPEAWLSSVYRPDVGVVTQMDGNTPTSSSSMPMAMAETLGAVRIFAGQKVCEIGAGTGYNAAVIAQRVGDLNMTTIEVDPDIVRKAEANLAKAGHDGVTVIHGDGLNLNGLGRFDRLVATCSVSSLPASWIEACPRGQIFAPWFNAYDSSASAVLDVEDGVAIGRFVPNLKYMPARAMAFSDKQPGRPTDPKLSSTWLRCPQVTDRRKLGAAFAIGAQLPDVFKLGTTDRSLGTTTVTLWDGQGSWARTSTPASMEVAQYPVEQAGPRDLWDEVEQAYRRWRSWGRPSTDRFGLTSDGETFTIWLDNADQPISDLP
ncbi:methyltransferase domain-containing protein [Catenulispora yoronensis]|uniref:Protein-L-isoaspartate O-methyltransferase n=1 Tax=Catenulispora yoronensis TaxID=450799 RepID=A0ABN2V1V6_9ACTN